MSAPSPSEAAIARGVSRLAVQKFGRNPAVGTSTEDIWNGGGLWPGFISAATTVRIAAGGDAADSAAGTGARLVRIEGLDQDGHLAGENVVTAGASASASTVTTFLRVFRAYALDCGSSGFNVGDVTIESTDGVTTFAVFPAEIGQSLLSFYTVPTGYQALLISLALTAEGGTAGTDVWMVQRRPGDPPQSLRGVVYYGGLVDSTISRNFSHPRIFPAGTDLWWQAVAGQGTSQVSVEYELDLVTEVL